LHHPIITLPILARELQVLAHGRRSCPICRSDIREEDLFDACSEEEARLQEQAAAAAGGSQGDYGAKVGGPGLGDPACRARFVRRWGGVAVALCSGN
jgi:hypothetical protein